MANPQKSSKSIDRIAERMDGLEPDTLRYNCLDAARRFKSSWIELGQYLFAVYKAAKEAVDRARAGGGPSFIEAVTYRLADHTTADDARRYRDAKELEAWINKDPILRLRKYLTARGLWSDAKHAESEAKGKRIAEEVAKAAEGLPTPTSDEFFDHMYAQPLPPELELQKRTLRTSSLGQNPEQVGLRAAR